MGITFDLWTLLTGVLIFVARVTDVTMGTLRTISIVHGKTRTAFFLGLLEVSLWLLVISTVINKITNEPLLGVFYALGFSTGNVVGILLERRMAFGYTVLRIISQRNGMRMAEKIRELGCAVTTFLGEGMHGPVTELYIVCHKGDCLDILSVVKNIEPDVFYITEQAGSASKIYRPFMPAPTGWRAIFKKK